MDSRPSLYLLVLLSLFAFSSSAEREKAALILGGYDARRPEGPVIDNVELFGCEGADGSIPVASLPASMYLMAGIYRFKEISLGCGTKDVLVCGGYTCRGSSCLIGNTCYTWDPAEDAWSSSDDGNMTASRWSFILAHGPDLDDDTKEDASFHTIAVGYNRMTEINIGSTWSDHRELPENNWYGLGCLFQDHDGDDAIYDVRNKVQRIDVTDWSLSDLGAVPQAFAAPGRCAPTEIDGQRGIFIRHGYFFGFEDKLWHTKAFPPTRNIVAMAANSMWSFRGRPTVFGNPKCNESGVCAEIEVLQYVPEDDSWISLGDMLTARTYQEVIEVPGEFCDRFVTRKNMGHH